MRMKYNPKGLFDPKGVVRGFLSGSLVASSILSALVSGSEIVFLGFMVFVVMGILLFLDAILRPGEEDYFIFALGSFVFGIFVSIVFFVLSFVALYFLVILLLVIVALAMRFRSGKKPDKAEAEESKIKEEKKGAKTGKN